MTEETLFELARKTPEAERPALLDRACEGKPELRQRVEALLQADAGSSPLLHQPIAMDATLGYETTSSKTDSDQIGKLIAGRYKLVESIGEGGMGSVWMAQQSEPVKRLVAIKLIKPGMDSKAVLARFDAERQALAMMDHPNIAKVLDGGLTDDRRPYFVMELVKGTPITTFCDERKLSLQQRLELFVPVCQAIQHAHQKGIIHRDIKPSNVLIALYDDKPVPKVIDFGVAKATGAQLTEQTLNTGFGAIVGTPEYMSPEQAALNNLDIDTRSDVYALGVLLYELLTGSTPVDRKSLKQAALMEVLRIIREDEPPRPSTKLSTAQALPSIAANRHMEPTKLSKLIKGELDWIVMKALEKDRSRRYETANGFAADVLRYLSGEPVTAVPASVRYQVQKFYRRNKPAVISASLVVVALTMGMAGTTWGMLEAQHQKQLAERESSAKERAWQAEAAQAQSEQRAKQLADQEAQAARKAEAETKAFSIFLVEDVLAAARPKGLRGGLGREVSVREALEKCSPFIPMRFNGQPRAEALAQHNIGVTFRLIGDLPRAEWHLRRAVSLREKELGTQHADTLSSKNSLAVVLNDAGKPQPAITLFEEVLNAGSAILEPNTRFTIENNLSLAYRAIGQWKKSLAIQEENLKRGEMLLGKDHEDVLTTRMNYAAVLHDAGELTRSRELYNQVLARHEATLGEKHPTTLLIKANLATLYLDLDDIVTARRLLEEVVSLEKALMGPDHHTTLASLINLAAVYREAGEVDRSIAMYRDVIDRQKKQLNPEHNDINHALHNLAMALRVKGERTEAIDILKKVIDQRTNRLGPIHPATLASRNQLAGCYLDQEQYAAARAMYQDILTIEQKAWGDDHPDTLKTHSNLALTYLEEGRIQEALPMYQRLLSQRQKTLGPQHESTLTTMHRLAVIHMRLRQFEKADPLYQELLQRAKTRFGAEHPETLSITNNYATMCYSWQKLDRSIPLFEALLAIDRKLHGHNHRSTLLVQGNLAMNYLSAHRTDEALPLVRDMFERGKQHSFAQFALLLKELSSLLIDQQQWVEAEPLLLERYTLAQQKKDNSHELQEIVDQLMLLYTKTLQPEKAAKWQEEKDKLAKGPEKK